MPASCGEDPPPPPGGPLRLHWNGVVQAGSADVSDVRALLKARATEGPVSVEVDPDASFEGVARLVDDAAASGLAGIELRSPQGRVVLRLGASPAKSPVPGLARPDGAGKAGQIRAVGECRLETRPDRHELRVRMFGEAPRVQLEEAIRALLSDFASGSVVLVLEARGRSTWGQLAPIAATVSAIAGDRVVRHELVAAP